MKIIERAKLNSFGRDIENLFSPKVVGGLVIGFLLEGEKWKFQRGLVWLVRENKNLDHESIVATWFSFAKSSTTFIETFHQALIQFSSVICGSALIFLLVMLQSFRNSRDSLSQFIFVLQSSTYMSMVNMVYTEYSLSWLPYSIVLIQKMDLKSPCRTT